MLRQRFGLQQLVDGHGGRLVKLIAVFGFGLAGDLPAVPALPFLRAHGSSLEPRAAHPGNDFCDFACHESTRRFFAWRCSIIDRTHLLDPLAGQLERQPGQA